MMKTKRIIPVFFILILILWPVLPFVESAGYGEENENLGQFTDDFENDDNVSVAVNVINNQTLDCMELNYIAESPDYENFTEYTEIDPLNRYEVTDFETEFYQWRRDDDCIVYFDYGVDFFDDFQIDMLLRINDTEAGDADNRWINQPLTITNWAGDFQARPGLYDILSLVIRDDAANDNKFRISLTGVQGGAGIGEVQGKIRDVSENEFGIRLNRTDDDCYLWIFDDETFTTIDEFLSINNTILTNKLRYLYSAQSLDIAGDGEIWMSGSSSFMWLGNVSGGFEADGYFITTDYLNYTTGQGLVLLTNASIPYDTSMTVQFSNDNATWVDNEGNVGSTPVLDGFYAIDLRDLNYTDSFKRYNLTTADTNITPRLYQSRLVTTNGTAGVGPGPGPPTEDNFFWIFIAIVLSIITALLVWMKFGNQ